MTPVAAAPWLGHEFDKFLFATIGEDKNGLLLSVVSVLGRSNLDPWEEAASLASLPKVVAAQRFSVLLGALPDPALQQDSDAVATRLIALLPQQTKSKMRLSAPSSGTATAAHPRANLQMLLIGIYLICLLGTQLVIAHLRQTHSNVAPASESPTATTVQTLPVPHR